MNKLLKAGLIKEDGGGYVADRIVFERMIKFRGATLPLQTAVATFFLAALTVLLVLLRPPQFTSEYVFSLAVIGVAFVIAAIEANKTAKMV